MANLKLYDLQRLHYINNIDFLSKFNRGQSSLRCVMTMIAMADFGHVHIFQKPLMAEHCWDFFGIGRAYQTPAIMTAVSKSSVKMSQNWKIHRSPGFQKIWNFIPVSSFFAKSQICDKFSAFYDYFCKSRYQGPPLGFFKVFWGTILAPRFYIFVFFLVAQIVENWTFPVAEMKIGFSGAEKHDFSSTWVTLRPIKGGLEYRQIKSCPTISYQFLILFRVVITKML